MNTTTCLFLFLLFLLLSCGSYEDHQEKEAKRHMENVELHGQDSTQSDLVPSE